MIGPISDIEIDSHFFYYLVFHIYEWEWREIIKHLMVYVINTCEVNT